MELSGYELGVLQRQGSLLDGQHLSPWFISLQMMCLSANSFTVLEPLSNFSSIYIRVFQYIQQGKISPSQSLYRNLALLVDSSLLGFTPGSQFGPMRD